MRISFTLFLVSALIIPALAYGEMAALNPQFVKWQAQQSSLKKKSVVSEDKTRSPIPPLTRRPSPINREHMKDKSIVFIPESGLRKALPVPTEIGRAHV